MIRPNMWPKSWSKHAAVCCVYILISVYVFKCQGSIMFYIQLTHVSCIIQMKFYFTGKHKSSPSQQTERNAIQGSDRLPP